MLYYQDTTSGEYFIVNDDNCISLFVYSFPAVQYFQMDWPEQEDVFFVTIKQCTVHLLNINHFTWGGLSGSWERQESKNKDNHRDEKNNKEQKSHSPPENKLEKWWKQTKNFLN